MGKKSRLDFHVSMRDLWTKHRRKYQLHGYRKTKNGRRAILDSSKPLPLRRRPPKMPNSAWCLCCGKEIGPAMKGDSPWSCPAGAVLFGGGDNFGSTLYDSMVNGVRVMVVICDACMAISQCVALEWYEGTNDGKSNKRARVQWHACGQSWSDKKRAQKAWKESRK